MPFCPVPHTPRDQIWLGVGALLGACAAAYSIRSVGIKPHAAHAAKAEEEKEQETSASFVTCESWGIHPQTKEEVFLWSLRNDLGMTVQITTLGCAVSSVKVPVGENQCDVVCGYDKLESYLNGKHNFGSIVGRCANRVAKGQFALDGKTYQLATNNGASHIHGGPTGFFCRNFASTSAIVTTDAATLTLGYHSPDGEEGYPGGVDIAMVYTLPRGKNALEMRFEARNATAPTLLSLTNHAYWNLSGHAAGSVATHELSMPHCSRYTLTDSNEQTTGETPSVVNTELDFVTRPRQLGFEANLDENYCIDSDSAATDARGLRLAASIKIPDLEMRVLTDAPGIQVYSCAGIAPAANAQWLVPGKGGVLYQRYGALCLETQNWPDAVNQKGFPHDSVLRPGEEYSHTAVYEFL